MVNHIRTLLLNSCRDSNGQLEEYIPASFVPVELSPELALIRSTLFDYTNDRDEINFRLRQLLTILHSDKDLEEYVLEPDKRITYWPFRKTSCDIHSTLELPDIYLVLREGLHIDESSFLFKGKKQSALTTFSNLWHSSVPLLYKLAAITLALAYKIDESQDESCHLAK